MTVVLVIAFIVLFLVLYGGGQFFGRALRRRKS